MPHRLASLQKELASLEADFQTLANSIPQLAWMTRPDGWIFWYNERWFDYTGTTLEQMEGWGWDKVHHADHIERVTNHFKASLEKGQPWEDMFPLRSKTGEFRWFLSRAMPVRDAAGNIIRWFGTNTDVTDQKQAEERLKLLMGEVDHRAKNVLAVAQAVVNLTKGDTVEQYKQAVEGRIAALARAHSLLADSRWEGASVEKLVREEVLAFADAVPDRVTIKGAPLTLKPALAQSLALMLHELTTNAAKYGALSQPDAHLAISWIEQNDGLVLRWQETGVVLNREPGPEGFGSTLLERLTHDFEQSLVERTWKPDGLTVTIALSNTSGALKPSRSNGKNAPKRPARRTPTDAILVVEDEVLTAIDLQYRLEDAGRSVLGPAGTIDEARKIFETYCPQIALLDANVGGERSYGFALELQQAGVEIIFCTGYEELDDLPEALQGTQVLSKPLQQGVLDKAIAAATTRTSAAASTLKTKAFAKAESSKR